MADLPVSLPETEQGNTRGQVIVPPRVGERTARRQTVLDEETYTRGLSQIIQRDFFPDLPRLRAQNAYLHALEEGDVGSIESCARALVREEARAGVLEDMTRRGEAGNTLTPVAMGGDATPMSDTGFSDLDLDLTEPGRSAISTPFDDAGADGSTDGSMPWPSHGKKRRFPLLLMSMDEYQTRYTTEDNASFAQLMDLDRKRRRDKYQWAYDAAHVEQAKRVARIDSARSEAEQGRQLAMPERLLIDAPASARVSHAGTPSRAVSNSAASSVSATSTTSDSVSMMPPPPPPSRKRIEARTSSSSSSQNAAPRVLHANTRLPAQEASETSEPSTPSSSVLDRAMNASSTPRIHGYNFVSATSTPRAEHMGERRLEQLMTWGQLAATPRRLDTPEPPTPSSVMTDATPLASQTPSQTPSRTPSHMPSATPRRSSGAAPRTPSTRRLHDLSPAARSLLHRTSRSASSLYRMPSSTAASSASTATPSSSRGTPRWTPTPSPVTRRF